MARHSATCNRHHEGMIYLAVLFLVAALGAGLAALGRSWAIEAQRDKEAQLLDGGNLYRRAIGRYYEATPGAIKAFPPDINSLLLDPRFPHVVRHMRQPVIDPVTGKSDWVLLAAPGGGIAGVASRSEQRPLKQSGFSGRNQLFADIDQQRGDKMRYRDWEFVHSPGATTD